MILICLSETVVFWLYRLPIAAAAYASAICLFIGSVFLLADFLGFRKKHAELELMKKEADISLARLPQPASATEEDYQTILKVLFEEKQALAQRTEDQYRELVEYYTVWVHQIKTPIAAMRLLLSSCEADAVPELKEELQKIEQYVEMVLCYLRLDGDSTDYVIREYDLDEIVKQAVRRHASVFIRKKLRLEYEPLHTRVVTDEKWLLFVIEQVLSNALKYTLSEGGTISVSMEPEKVLCIRDTGIGIAPEDLPRIFERGYTGKNGRADMKASGLGLYLCRRICENLGHQISVFSKPGEGTLVRIDLKNWEPANS